MFSASDLRKGLKVEIEGAPYVITEFNFVKPGKGQALYTCKMKNMINGSTLTKTYRSNDKFEKPALNTETLAYSYNDGANFIFMNKDYEQVDIAPEVLGLAQHFLTEDAEAEVLFYNGEPVEVTLATFVEKKIVQTEPGARGDTATNVVKPATIEGGYELNVPIFVNEGDVIKIDTRVGEYCGRA